MSGAYVVVGVDGTDESLVAVDFAAAEARLRRVPLHIVHATSIPYTGESDDGTRQTLDAAQRRAVAPPSDLTVTTAVVVGAPVAALSEAAAGAAVLVVGRRAGSVARLRSTSVVANIAAKAPCPVIVVQGVSEPRTNILVGIGTSESTQAALALAFEEADLRDTNVTAIHAWRSPALASHGVAGGLGFSGGVENNSDAARVLAEAIAGWRTAYPEVEVHRSVPEGSAIDALVQASIYAQMVIIGIPRSGVRSSIMVHELIRRATCPVGIVPIDLE